MATIPNKSDELFTFLEYHGVIVEYGSDINYPLYHISAESDKEGIWNPVVPLTSGLTADSKVWQRDSEYEPPIPRICLAPSIEQCRLAVLPAIDDSKFDYFDFSVYRPKLKPEDRVVVGSTLVACEFTFDAAITDEHWILTPVYMELIDTVRLKIKLT